ncbi:MAG: chemotaxis protein CheA [Paenibacillaceae bacterium]
MEMNQYLAMFIEESKDHLQSLNENLLKLEQKPDDIEVVQVIFRSAHTLKGMSATMGYQDIASLTHEMENVLDLVRNNKLAMNGGIFDALFKGTDFLEIMVQDIIDGGTGKADVSSVVVVLQAIVSGDFKNQGANDNKSSSSFGQEMELDEYQFSVLEQSLDSGFYVYYIKVSIRDDCVLKAARAYMVFDVLERHGEVVKSSPSVQEIEQEKFDKYFTVYYLSKQEEKEIKQLIVNVSEIDTAEIINMDKETLDQIVKKDYSTTNYEQSSIIVHNEVAATAQVTTTAKAAPATMNRTIRVDIERLDVLMNLFSELLIDRVRLEALAEEIKRNDLSETIEHMSRVSSDLQNIVLKLRMVPVESVFNRFPRVIRDLAKSLDKKVNLVLSGEETELDRTVIDEIGDPLVHLLRNSLDHGIESTGDRIKAGKSETGTINLRAFHSGNHVFIEIEDDGRGINRDKVLQIAIKNNIVSPEIAQTLTDDEIYRFLFAPGFSTADKISDISGRGVGLDVVTTRISSLGGHVNIESRPGLGTKFSVQLPLTLSIIGAMLIRVSDEKYAIPLSSIVETAIIESSRIRKVHGKSMIDFRNTVIPVIAIDELLNCKRDKKEIKVEHEIVIVRKGDKLAALIVDELIGQQEIVLKTLGKYLVDMFAISGATILGDGQVALILDTNAMIK